MKVLIHSITNIVLLGFRVFEEERSEPTARDPIGSRGKMVSFLELSSFTAG